MRHPFAILCALLCCLLLAACGEDDGAAPAGKTTGWQTPSPTATPTATEAPVECSKVKEPKPKKERKLPKPTLSLDPAKTYVAAVSTSCGDFEITLDAKRAPKTGGAFVTLARDGFFDNLIFHRIVPGFVIQGGDPQGTGLGGPGFSIVEAPPADLAYTKGVVAMAKAGPEAAGTSGSQFFVVIGDDVGLPPEYALLGKVTKGIEVADAIGAAQVGPDERPVSPVVIKSIVIRDS